MLGPRADGNYWNNSVNICERLIPGPIGIIATIHENIRAWLILGPFGIIGIINQNIRARLIIAAD
jgi:hypothetical protein